MNSFSVEAVDEMARGLSFPEPHALACTFRSKATSDDIGDPWHLLDQVFSIHLRHGDPAEPFGPMIVMDGRRSMVPGDLTNTEVELLRNVLSGSTTPVVRARIGDVLWVARKDGRAGAAAVPAYLALGTVLENPDQWVACMECYERAIRLARSLGRTSPLLTDALQHLLDRVLHYKGEDSSYLTSRGLALLNEFRAGDPATLGKLGIIGADRRRDAGDPYSARVYYEIAARLLSRAGLAQDSEYARKEAAQTWVAEAGHAEAAGNYGAAQAHLNSAIQMYRELPSCKELLPSLHSRLDAAGMGALKLMKQIGSAPIDIGPMVLAARKNVIGMPMSEAIYAFACIAPSLNPTKLRVHAEEMAKQAPLSAMFSSVLYDRAGRIVHKSPGLFTDDPDEREQALDAHVARHADLHRNLTVQAQIVPALMAILSEHVVEASDILDLLQGSVLVADGRADLFALGFEAGFRRDFVTATHLLVPQLEHALRVLLRDAGVIAASIDQDGIQSDWPLGRLLSTSEIRKVLPETLIFELRTLLIYKGSSNIRNMLCHGLMSSAAFATANVFYLWWIILKIALHGTPNFQEWTDERSRNWFDEDASTSKA
ncbi:MAG: DUF4209 domain-containing protein [Janthinobacterium lividum]